MLLQLNFLNLSIFKTEYTPQIPGLSEEQDIITIIIENLKLSVHIGFLCCVGEIMRAENNLKINKPPKTQSFRGLNFEFLSL